MNAFMQIEKACQKKPKGSLEPFFVAEKQAAAFLNVSVGFLRKCRSNGTGPEWVKFGNSVRYPISGLSQYVEKSRRYFTGQTETLMQSDRS